MKLDDIYLRATGVRFPALLPVADAIASGACTPQLVARTDVESVSVSLGESAAEMGVAAARSALARAGSTGAEVGLILHADTYHQGHDAWPVASYIQRETLGNTCPAIEIKQMSNGGIAMLDLAAAYLKGLPRAGDALLSTADRYCLPGFDRWRTDPGTPYADSGTAVVLSRRGGFARVLSLAMYSDSALEPMHRGDDPFGDAPFANRMPVDFEAAKRSFMKEFGLSFAISRANAGQQVVVKEALADAGLELPDADWVLLPHFGRRRLNSIYFEQFGIDPAKTTWEFSRTVGHLGAGDQFGSLDHLVVSGRARPGDRVVLVGVGGGYSWGAAVLEILDVPRWD
ncbi:3-oxoacyl-ACP synthase [Streptomyces sp. CB03234]|uniref:ketoacyl-ACP synthase III family protein n=1 Tax=Streptomyces sp. (strain CB03234) TaxID=1703937 RepID=UPI00093AF128|nr:ketoacyl-ACP synthase III family protein [Streptomyces sp. CB03234]OKJ94687.1 3-oxoacyl-ACP synthase [Streptomyces sp. CB03234]